MGDGSLSNVGGVPAPCATGVWREGSPFVILPRFNVAAPRSAGVLPFDGSRKGSSPLNVGGFLPPRQASPKVGARGLRPVGLVGSPSNVEGLREAASQADSSARARESQRLAGPAGSSSDVEGSRVAHGLGGMLGSSSRVEGLRATAIAADVLGSSQEVGSAGSSSNVEGSHSRPSPHPDGDDSRGHRARPRPSIGPFLRSTLRAAARESCSSPIPGSARSCGPMAGTPLQRDEVS